MPGRARAQEGAFVLQVAEPGRKPRAEHLANHAVVGREFERRTLLAKVGEARGVVIPPARGSQHITVPDVNVSDRPAHECAHPMQANLKSLLRRLGGVRSRGNHLQEFHARRFLVHEQGLLEQRSLGLLVATHVVDQRHAGSDSAQPVAHGHDIERVRPWPSHHLEALALAG